MRIVIEYPGEDHEPAEAAFRAVLDTVDPGAQHEHDTLIINRSNPDAEVYWHHRLGVCMTVSLSP